MAAPAGAPPAAPPPGAPPAAPPVGAPPAAPPVDTGEGGGNITLFKPFSAPPGAPPPIVNLPGLGQVQLNQNGTVTPLSGQYAGATIGQAADGSMILHNSDGTGKFLTGRFAGTTTKPTSAGWVDAATGAILAPAVGAVTAVADTASGHLDKVPGDVGYGVTGGIVGNNPGSPTTGLVNPDTVSQVGDAVSKLPGDAGTEAGKAATAIGDAIGGLGGGSSIDSSAAKSDHDRAMSLADTLSNQANTAGQTAAADRGQTDQTRAQQEQSISDLQDAAAGRTASAAEIQGKNQAAIDSARQYGLAAALQGNNPSAALRQASLGSAAVNGTNNANATVLRATEQANARNALASTLGNVRAADTGQQTTDIGQQTNLNNASATQSGQGVTSTGQSLDAQAKAEQARAIEKGALLSAGGTVLGTAISDSKAKKNIKSVGLADSLGKKVTGVTFEYKPEIGDDEPHFGVLADQIKDVIPGVVKPGPMGLKVIDTGHMTMANTGIIAELAKRIMELEKGKRK